jgi:hypothetical protein
MVKKIMIECKEYIPVVRCKDCKYRGDKGIPPYTVCNWWSAYMGKNEEIGTKDNDYCSYGERKENE